MTNRSYKLIFGLLSCCILFILLLQGYWIRNFYLREKGAFERNIYAALEKVTTGLKVRKDLQALKMTYFIVGGDTIAKTPSRSMKISTESNVNVVNRNKKNVTTWQVSKSNGHESIINDSVLINGGTENVNIVMNGKDAKVTVVDKRKDRTLKQVINESSKLISKTNDMKILIDKMITEIKVIDTETEQPDTIKAVIKHTLENQGIFLPFEFSIQKLTKGKKEDLVRSKGFSDQQVAYKSNLSASNIISTHEYLFLQFPGSDNFVMASIQGSLALSVFFSLLILGVFYYVIRLLLKQKRLSEIKTDFMNNMTHELKTPIATISLAVDGMNNPLVKNNPEKLDEYTRILKEESYKLNSHVERVLQVALLEKGQLQLHRQPLNVLTLIQAAVNTYALQIRQKNAVVNVVSAETEVLVNGDEMHLGNVFTNLLDNALKYARKEGIVIEITVARQNDKVFIVFSDNGIGIAENLQEKVFDKFYRVQGGNLHDVKGFGLGLSYVRSVVEAHGGKITLQSREGKGARFTITLATYAA